MFPPRPWNLLFFGTDEFSLASLRRVHARRGRIGIGGLEVVTTADRIATSRRKKTESHVVSM